jgi:hypothetical protein
MSVEQDKQFTGIQELEMEQAEADPYKEEEEEEGEEGEEVVVVAGVNGEISYKLSPAIHFRHLSRLAVEPRSV